MRITATDLTQWRPLGDEILVKILFKSGLKAQGGLLMYENEASKRGKNDLECPKGRIISVGKRQTDVKVGDLVLLNPYAGRDLSINDTSYSLRPGWSVEAIVHE